MWEAGTLEGLCQHFLNTSSFEEINDLIEQGNLDNVDLKIKDVTVAKIPTLPEDFTASNLAEISENASKSDLAMRICKYGF